MDLQYSCVEVLGGKKQEFQDCEDWGQGEHTQVWDEENLAWLIC